MKKRMFLVFIIASFSVITVYYYNYKDISEDNFNNIKNDEFSRNIITEKPEVYIINGYRVIIKNISDLNVIFIPNFNEKNTSDIIFDKYECNVLVNGGFYGENGKPLGLYYLDGTTYGKLKESEIYNGILYFNINNSFGVSDMEDFRNAENYKFYMQSGPLIKYNGHDRNLNTEKLNTRRIVFAQDTNNLSYIIIFSGVDNYNNGPDLTEVSRILNSLSSEAGINVVNALNLDGGNSSVFIDEYYSIKESVFAGSFICLKNKLAESDQPQ